MLKGKSLLEYANLFSPIDYEKNDKIILKYFRLFFKIKKIYCIVCGKYKELMFFENPWYFRVFKFFIFTTNNTIDLFHFKNFLEIF